jgi:uncharacterized protein YggE
MSIRALPVALAMIAALPASALAAENVLPQRTIIVTGEGEVLAQPDQARLSAAVVTQAPTAEAAAEQNAAAMNRVLGAVAALGIPPNRIRTSNYSIQPQYSVLRANDPATNPRAITGYQATNQITVTIDDLSKIGTISDTLVRSGANQMGGVGFTIADPKPLADRARAAAVNDATAKARTLADAAGVRLGPVLNIQEGPGAIRPLQFVAPRALAAAETTPIVAGEQPIIVGVTLTFAIQ